MQKIGQYSTVFSVLTSQRVLHSDVLLRLLGGVRAEIVVTSAGWRQHDRPGRRHLAGVCPALPAAGLRPEPPPKGPCPRPEPPAPLQGASARATRTALPGRGGVGLGRQPDMPHARAGSRGAGTREVHWHRHHMIQ